MAAIKSGNVERATAAKTLRMKLDDGEISPVNPTEEGVIFKMQDKGSDYLHARFGQVISFKAGTQYTVTLQVRSNAGQLGGNGDWFPELISPSINWFEGEEQTKWAETKGTIQTSVERGEWNTITTTLQAQHDQKARLQFAFYQDKGVYFKNVSLKG